MITLVASENNVFILLNFENTSNLGKRFESDRQVISFWRVKDLSLLDSVEDFSAQKLLLHLEFCQHAAILARSPEMKNDFDCSIFDFISHIIHKQENSKCNFKSYLKLLNVQLYNFHTYTQNTNCT